MWKHLDEEKDALESCCCVAAKRAAIKKMEDNPMKTLLLEIQKAKASIRAKVEHPFHIIKNLSGSPEGALQGAGQELGAAVQLIQSG